MKFFIDNPDYYQFLFYSQKITVHLMTGEIHEEDYPPYRHYLFRCMENHRSVNRVLF